MADLPKIAVFGCGYWGRNHIRTLAELGALACVVDVNTTVAEALATEHGSIARDADDVLSDPEIDAVVFALPAEHHAAMALRAFDAGKHVLVEKPIALSPKDGARMVEAARDAGKVFMTGHILCYHNAFRAIMNLVETGALGRVRYVQSHRLGFGKFHTKFDAAWDLAPHDLSMLLSVARRSPLSIDARPVSITGSQTDFAHIDLDFGQDLKGHIYVSRHSPYMERRVTVIGDKAMALWDDTAQDWNKKVSLHKHTAKRGDNEWTFSKNEPEFVPCEPNMALTDELSHFIHCIRSGQTPLTDGAQGLEVVRILSACS